MSTPPATASTLSFGSYRLDIAGSRLTRDGALVALRPKAFDLLAALASRANELVTKDELLDSVWGRRFITEGVIKSIVGELRNALGDDPKRPRWIETVPKRGYRFIGAIDREAIDPARIVTSDAALGNMPHSLSAPIGRDDALASVSSLFEAHRLVTIYGPSGVGKTRLVLALATAQRSAWRDGVWFIELASLSSVATDVAALCATVVQLLHMNASAGVDAKSLASALRPLNMVLVFDNAEHLLEPLSSLVATLLSGTTSLRIVITSQEPLHIADEQVYRLAPLSLPAIDDDHDEDRLMDSSAVQLFVQRVSARLHGFALAPDQQQTVAAICRALDGMPLAIELAAARVPLLGVRGIADLLLDGEHDARLQLLTGGSRTATPRQRSLRNAMEWSYRLLDESQQSIFRRLGVFRGGFTLVEAQAVCRDEQVDAWSVLDALDALVDKSLIESFEVTGHRRFRLLESLRAFALERLVDAGEDEATRDRHLCAVLEYWKTADARALDEPALAWAEPHRFEIDNLRSALRWADQRKHDAELVELVACSMLMWCRAGLGSEGYAWSARAQARTGGVDDRVLLLRLDLAIATLALYFGAYSMVDGLHAAERAAAGFVGVGDPVRAYFALYIVFQSNVREQNVFDRAALLQRMSELERPDWNDVRRRFLRGARNYDRRLAGDAVGYLEACRHELALCRGIGAVAEGWIAAQGLMLAEHDIGRVDEALEVANEAIDEIRAAGRLRQHPNFIALWATMLAEEGLTPRARAALVEALPILRSSGTPWMAYVALAWFAMHEGRDEDAARVIGHHAAMLRAGRAAESGAYIARSLNALSDRLIERIGGEAFESGRDAGLLLDDLHAERLALGQ